MLIKPRKRKPISFGSQIRSYILDRNKAVDHRSGFCMNADVALNGDINELLRFNKLYKLGRHPQ